MAFELAKNFSICLILVLCACACAADATSRASNRPSAIKKFEEWMTRHGRNYRDVAEKAKRLEIFLENLRFVEEFNGAANRTYKVGLNKFSDLTNEEFVAGFTGYKVPSSTRSDSSRHRSFEYQDMNKIPKSVDWVKKGAVNHVKDQGRCESCWSFSVVAAVEAITKISSGVLLNLSEQQLIDCATEGGNQGCDGGRMDSGFQYIIDNQGISSTADYPYIGLDGFCNTQATSVTAAKIAHYRDISPNEDDMLMAVATQPVSAALDSHGAAFQSYRSGVFTGPCGENLTHAVTVVGYGKEADGTKYWLIRNSWGVSWGENGYMRILRGSGVQGGLCGLALMASYPVA